MTGKLLQLLLRIRASYWFVPALMALGSLVLGFAMVYLDAIYQVDTLGSIAWLYESRPEGARQILSTIAGSMITVAGVVFSLTIAAVSYAAGQYGARLLTNFMRDLGNQITLGTFVGTFLYCLIVLRTVRSAQEAAAETGTAAAGFVPHLAMLVAFALALASIAVLIFFIHHVTNSIHVNTVISKIGRLLIEDIGDRFPAFIGAAAERCPPRAVSTEHAVRAEVAAPTSGYITVLDDRTLLHLAHKHDLLIRLRYAPGDFIHKGRPLLPVEAATAPDDALRDALADAYAISDQRSLSQDLRFLVNELVEIAARALSPGVNDPFTAIACLDWLEAAAADLGTRDLPTPGRAGEDGVTRIIALPFGFDTFVALGFGQLRPYLATDRNAARHALTAMAEAGLSLTNPDRRRVLAVEMERLDALAAEALPKDSAGLVADRARLARGVLAGTVDTSDVRWMGGSAG